MTAAARSVGAPGPEGSGADETRFAAAAQRFADTVAFSDLRAVIPSCPGWSAYDLVVHLGNVHAWAATILETGHRAAGQNDEPTSARPRAVSEWYAAKAEDLYQVMRWVDPGATCWTLTSEHGTADFWQRRQLHETIVHALDLDHASGRPTPVPAGVAADGVDEVLEVMLVRMHRRGHPAALPRPLQLLATDTGDSWVVSPAGGDGAHGTLPPVVEHHHVGTEPGPGRPADPGSDPVPHLGADRVEGTAEALYRALWHRPVTADALRLVGDTDRVRAFLSSPLTP